MASQPEPGGLPSAERSSSDPLSIEIYLFHCGHGDTILVRLPGDRWGMIDCYLPEQYGIRRKFFEFVREKEIRALDFIFQTHPDRDHYHGMEAVIEYFLGRGERIRKYIDTGLNARCARHFLQRVPGALREYEALQERLANWRDSGELEEWGELGARFLSLVPDGYDGRIEFVPIGPDPGEKRRIMTADLRRLASRPGARSEANDLSLVIVLAVMAGDRVLNVLLGADVGAHSLRQALDYWTERARAMGRDAAFDVVKVPHHGSIRSHVSGLCAMKRSSTGAETAAVSAGTRRCLPDREVLKAYLENGWNVLATTTRSGAALTSLPMTLADRGASDEGDVVRHTIRLAWTSATGLSVEPSAAKITTNDLTWYETALT